MFSSSSKIKIPFHDVDIMNVVWHGHYAKYFEIARTGLMKSLGLDYPQLIEHGVAMPVVDFKARYVKALRYDDEVEVIASISNYNYPELIINYEIKNSRGEILTKGMSRQIYMSIEDMKVLFEVPETILSKFNNNEK